MKKRDKHAFRLSLCRANIFKQMQIFKVKTKKRLGVAGCKVVWVLIRKGSQMRRNRTLSSLRGWDFISTANSEEQCEGSVTTSFLARFVCFQKRSNVKIIDRRRATGNGERENELPQGQSFDERRAERKDRYRNLLERKRRRGRRRVCAGKMKTDDHVQTHSA